MQDSLSITIKNTDIKKAEGTSLPGGPVVKTSPSNAGGSDSIPGQGAKSLHAWCPKNQNIKKIL